MEIRTLTVCCCVALTVLFGCSSSNRVVCLTKRGATILYREPLTVYRLEGQVLSLVSNQSHVSQTDSSRKYTWSTSPKVYIKIIEERWLGERATVEYMNKTYDGVKVRYTVPLTTNNTFKSEWATLRLGARPKISRGKGNMNVEVNSSLICFNMTGNPKPSLKIYRDDESQANISSTRYTIDVSSNCLSYGPLKQNDTGTIGLSAENCFGRANATFYLRVTKRPPTTEPLTWTNTGTATERTTQSPVGEEGDTSSGFPLWAISVIAVFSISVLLILLLFLICFVTRLRSKRKRTSENQGTRSEVALEPSYAEPEKVMKLPTSNEPKSKATDHGTTLPGYETLYPNISTSSKPDECSSTIPVNKEIKYAALDTSIMQGRTNTVQGTDQITYASMNAEQPKSRSYEN